MKFVHPWLLLLAPAVVLLIPHVCSYFIYRRLEGCRPSEGGAP